MSKLIFKWLNDEVGLSKHVVSFEDDFRDGCLLGELLYRYNQQDNFGDFENKFTPDARIKNYCLLEPTIRRLGLDFNFKLAFDIMNGKHGVTRALLAELRPLLERIQKNSEPPIATEGQRGQIMRVMKPGNERFDKSMSMAFEKSVRVHMDNPTEVILQNTVGAHFQAIGRASDALAAEGDNYDAWATANDQKRKREVFEHRKKHEQEFHKAWDLLNVEQWRKNQATGKARKDDEAFQVTSYNERKSAHFASQMEKAKNDIAVGISAFDKRLEKEVFREDESLQETLGITLKKTVRGGDGSGLPELEYLNQRYLDEGLNLALKTMKEHHEDELARQVSHDRRRRKFVRMRENYHSQSLQHIAQSEIVDQLKYECRVEALETEQRSKVYRQTAVMAENRAVRESKVGQISEETGKNREAWLAQIAQREEEWVVSSQVEALATRAGTLESARSSAERFRNEEFIGETIDRLLDLTDWVVTSRHLGLYHHSVVQPKAPAEGEEGAEEAPVRVESASGLSEEEEKALEKALLPWHLWDDAKCAFVSGLGMSEALMEPYPTNVSLDLPHSQSEKPLGVDLSWLLSNTFQAHIALAPPGSLEAELVRLSASMQAEAQAAKANANKVVDADASAPAAEGEEEKKVEGEAAPAEAVDPAAKALVPTLGSGDSVPSTRVISEHLASCDSTVFVATVAAGAEAGAVGGVDFEVVPEGVSVPAVNQPADPAAEGYEEGKVVTPDWLYTTPSKYLLGEVLIAASCAADPLPEDPVAKLDVSTVPMRLAVAGVSDSARQALSGALLEANPALKIINLEKLVHQAVQVASEVLDREADEDKSGSTEEEKVALQVHSFLAAGKVVPDFLYVKLLVAAIAATLPPVAPVLTPEELYAQKLIDNDKTEKALAKEAEQRAAEAAEVAAAHPGFILEDFPVTRKQAVLLCEAISGIDYESPRPRPADKASAFAQARPDTYEPSYYDPAKCGLNRIVYVDVGDVASLSEQRTRARVDLRTGAITAVGKSDSDQLQTLYTPLRPVQTASLEYSCAASEQGSLVEFATHVKLLSSYAVSEWEGDFKSLDEAVAAAVTDTLGHFFPTSAAEDDAVAVEGEEEKKQVEKGDNGEDGPSEESKGEDEAEAEAPAAEVEAAPVALVTPAAAALSQAVAKYLVGTWKAVETKCTDRTRAFYGSLRDCRYEMLQRRRTVHDVVYKHLVARDKRQEMFENFRDGFNDVSWDCRYDKDFIHEMNLRALELGKELWQLCDTRSETCAAILKKFMRDGEVALNVHMVQVEGAAVIQSEYERFVVSVHVLQDFCRGVANFDSRLAEGSVLEACLEPEVPTLEAAAAAAAAGAGGKKDAGKKAPAKGGKGAPAEAEVTRAVYPPIVLPVDQLRTLPVPSEEEEIEDPKAKGKGKPPAKGKGGAEEAASDPLSVMIAAVTAAAHEFTKEGGFAVQRAVFPDQEELCVALEAAVWHEAARLQRAISIVKHTVSQQVQWLGDSEKDLSLVMDQVLRERHLREYAQVDRLLDMIHEVVRLGEPIRELWELSPDSIVVHQNQLVLHVPQAPPMPVVQPFPQATLNDQQLATLRDWAEQCKVKDALTGDEILLSQDVEAMLQRAANAVGPVAYVKHTTYDNPFIQEDEIPSVLALVVKVVRCKDLPNLDASTKGSGVSDPFITIHFQGQKNSTKVVDNDLSPEFNEVFHFEWTVEPDAECDQDFALMKLEAWDHDVKSPPDSIGTVRLDINESGLKEKLLAAYKAAEGSDDRIVNLDPLTITDSSGNGNEEGTLTLELSVKDVDTEDELMRESMLTNASIPDGWRADEVFAKISTLLAPVEAVNGKPNGFKENCGVHSLEGYKSALPIDSSDLVEKEHAFSGHV
jgi:hypothetical protein